MTLMRTWRRTTERSGSSTRAWTCRAAVAAEIARTARFRPRLWQRQAGGSRRPVAKPPRNGVNRGCPHSSRRRPGWRRSRAGTRGADNRRAGRRRRAERGNRRGGQRFWWASRRGGDGDGDRAASGGAISSCAAGDRSGTCTRRWCQSFGRQTAVHLAWDELLQFVGLKKVAGHGCQHTQEAGAGAPRTFWRDFSARPGQGHPKGPRTAEKVRHRVRGGWVGGWVS